jgi:FkbM family methyltransferase
MLGQKRGIEVAIAGCKMRLHPAFCTQNWEKVEAESYGLFAAAVRPGAVVFDIGAHIGTYTLVAAKKTGPTGRIVAYEPHDYTREHLQRHLRWNGADAQTTVRDVCCGASEGSADFYNIPGQAEGMNGLVPVHGFQKRAVKVVPLDKEVADLVFVPDIIKIDVEGAEWDVLKGAEKTLERNHPILFLSLHPHALAIRGESPEVILDWLEQRGYSQEVIARDHEIHVVARWEFRP